LEKRFLNTADAAKFLGLSVSSVNRYVEMDTIPSHKVGGRRFFDQEELVEWIRGHNSHGVQRAVTGKGQNKKQGGAYGEKQRRSG
jgi:excisionase family DNA binding protein